MKRKGSCIGNKENGLAQNPDFNLRFLRVPASISKEEAWLQLMERLSEKQAAPRISIVHSMPFRILAVAASSIIILVSAYFLLLGGRTTLTTEYGQMTSAYLPDSSVVYLNSGTTLQYNSRTWTGHREVKLEGEALFKVKPGSKFSVITSKSVTSVLGTSFNVYARGAEVRVCCITGKVLVTSKYNGESKLLLPGNATKVIENAHVELRKTNVDLEAKWVDGKFYFQQARIERVFEEMERQYNIKIVYRGGLNRTYSGFFTNTNLPSALDLVCIPMQLHYKKLNANTIEVY